MRRTVKIIPVLLSLILLFSCTADKYKVEIIDGVKYIKNTGEPTAAYTPKTKLLFEIQGPENVPDSMKGFGEITQIIADFNDNIYILDGIHATIKKYNRNGEFERYFPEQYGSGIEQLKKPTQIVLMYDTLTVYDHGLGKYIQFMTNGRFIQSQFVMTGVKPVALKSDGKTNLSTFIAKIEKGDSTDVSVNQLCVLNDRLKTQYVVREIRAEMNKDFFFPDLLTFYSVKDGMFYTAENKSDKYRIYVDDNRGNSQYVIEKKFTKVPYNEFEREKLNEFIVAAKFPPMDSTRTYYKKAVSSIEIDKLNRIWTQPSLERTEANEDSLYVDIFDEGIFVNRTVLDFVKRNETYTLLNNRLYVISEDRKSVRVYDYE